MAAPPAVEEGRLEDDVGAVPHRRRASAPRRRAGRPASAGRPSAISTTTQAPGAQRARGTPPRAGRPSPGSARWSDRRAGSVAPSSPATRPSSRVDRWSQARKPTRSVALTISVPSEASLHEATLARTASARLSRPRYPASMSPEHRKPDGTRKVGPTWESLVERQIREAMEEGAFDDLPHQGERLPIEDDSRGRGVGAGLSDAPQRRRRATVDRGGQGGPQLGWPSWRCAVARAAVAAGTARARQRDEVERLVSAINGAIERLNAEAPTDRQHRRPLDVDEVLRRRRGVARMR